ncbi:MULTISPECIES: hypothetical protein [Asanoa]|uniref:Uncharacterized protein n=2 Tax=Asanoa TaxID=195964 RepID=A0A239PGI9_9ACTN|nr:MULTISPECIES: hypothetical protein [Asanoa]GIF74203.1 hypothetical protein Asi02nite_37210 [Asanoa siamensis]SNT65718.1 hypothetical protein SAMN05421812_12561 [Asanoa hainanensis]
MHHTQLAPAQAEARRRPRLRTGGVPRLLAGAMALLLAVAVAGCSGSDDPYEGSGGNPPLVQRGLGDQSSTPTGAPGGSGNGSKYPGAEDCVGKFAQAWSQPTLSKEAWLGQVKPLADPQMNKYLDTIDPQIIKSTQVQGMPEPVTMTNLIATMNVKTDGGTLRITCTYSVDGWRAARVDTQGS